MRKAIFFTAILLSTATFSAAAQTNQVKAKILGEEAVKIMDEGKVNEAIIKLTQAHNLDSEHYDYLYEIAYAYNLKKDYPQALQVMQRVIKYKDINDRCYQMLGNLYDMTGDSVAALKTYKEGLRKFPNSGNLYLEQGNIYFNRKQYSDALPFYELGIDKAPMFASNYYRAAILYLSSPERIWGMIYGELFMNLERGSERTERMSKMLYDTYGDAITKHGDSINVSFSKQVNTIDAGSMVNGKFHMPFAMVYENTTAMCAAAAKNLDYAGLCDVRRAFTEVYYKNGFNKDYPNVLFAYQDKLLKAGLLDVYNHWLLSQGNPEQFNVWRETHTKEWESFLQWYEKNKMQLGNTNKFTREKA